MSRRQCVVVDPAAAAHPERRQPQLVGGLLSTRCARVVRPAAADSANAGRAASRRAHQRGGGRHRRAPAPPSPGAGRVRTARRRPAGVRRAAGSDRRASGSAPCSSWLSPSTTRLPARLRRGRSPPRRRRWRRSRSPACISVSARSSCGDRHHPPGSPGRLVELGCAVELLERLADAARPPVDDAEVGGDAGPHRRLPEPSSPTRSASSRSRSASCEVALLQPDQAAVDEQPQPSELVVGAGELDARRGRAGRAPRRAGRRGAARSCAGRAAARARRACRRARSIELGRVPRRSRPLRRTPPPRSSPPRTTSSASPARSTATTACRAATRHVRPRPARTATAPALTAPRPRRDVAVGPGVPAASRRANAAAGSVCTSMSSRLGVRKIGVASLRSRVMLSDPPDPTEGRSPCQCARVEQLTDQPWDTRVQFRTDASGRPFSYRPNQVVTVRAAVELIADRIPLDANARIARRGRACPTVTSRDPRDRSRAGERRCRPGGERST